MTTITQHPTYRAFLADIIKHPEDDAIRLILADWLEDHGEEEQAEFIRVQVELDRGGLRDAECNKDAFHSKKCRGDKRDRCERAIYLKHRESKLLDAYLFDRLTAGCGGGTARYTFRRGFLSEIHAPLSVLDEHLPRQVQEQPIEAVRVTDKAPFHSDAFEYSHRQFWFNAAYWGTPYAAPRVPASAVLPVEVFNRLPTDMKGYDAQDYTEWQDLDAAHAALSVALLRWAKVKPAGEPAP